MNLKFIFPSDPEDLNQIDSSFEYELSVVKHLGLENILIDIDNLKSIKKNDKCGVGIYRGWMVCPNTYRKIYTLLLRKQCIQMMVFPCHYERSHCFMENWKVLSEFTPKTIYFPPNETHENIMAGLKTFDGKSIVLKDYVKSQKHFWNEACFIPSSSDCDIVKRVVNRFKELQDPIEGGLVFREYVDLVNIGYHKESKLPISLEYRVVIVENEIVTLFPYWSGVTYPNIKPPIDFLKLLV